MAEFTTKRNDTKPLTGVLKDTTGTVKNLTGATLVFTMTGPDGLSAKKVDRGSVTIVVAADGSFTYPWQTGETDTAGQFKGEIELTDSSGLVETFPSDGSLSITINGDLDEQ